MLTRILLATLLALVVLVGPADSANVLLVVRNSGSLTSQDTARKTQFESWGHTVTVIDDGDSQATYNAQLAVADVAYIVEEVASASLGYKLREATVGVINEEQLLIDEYGLSSSAYTSVTSTTISITNNTHPLTSGFSTGTLAFTSPAQELTTVASFAAGGSSLATVSGGHALVVVEAGGTLATTYNSSNVAFGRRIKLPIGGSSFDWNALSTNGLQLVRNSVEWAAEMEVGLVGHWKLDETSGTTATDSSDTANDGSHTYDATPGAAGPGVSNGLSASFDGVEDRVLIPSNTAYDITNAITVSAWVNFDQAIADQTSQQSLVSRFTWSGKKGFQLFTDQPSSNSIRFRLLNGSWKDAVWTNPDIDAGGWRHVVGTYDGATIRLYVDGELKDTENKTDALAAHTGADLSLGANLDGRLADVRIYNRALGAGEIAEMNGMIARWKLNESSGTNADDSSPYGHDATLTGTQGWTAGKDGGGHESDYSAGADDYFTAPSTTVLDDAHKSNYTVMAYFKPNSVPPGSGSNNNASYGVLIKQGNHLGIHYNSSQQFQIEHVTNGPNYHGVDSGTITYPPGSFYHVASVVDYAAGTAKLYVDGLLIDTVTFTPGATPQNYGSNRWRLGIAGPGDSTYRWAAHGVIDDARIYARSLSDDEITEYAVSGLVGHWKLTETSGTTAVDSSPSGADGTYENGVALDQGGPYPGVTAPVFDGTNDHVELPAINANFQAGLTIAAWIQPDAALGSGQFYEILDLSNGSEEDQILFTYNGAAGLQLFLTDTADGSSIRTIEDNTGFAAGRWVHCVATIDSSGFGKIYRNGKVTKSGFFTSLPTNVSRSTATIGKSSFGDHFGGGLQDVRLYNYELTAAEIAEIYGLVGKWDFDEGSGTTIAESTGLASDATFHTGTPEWVDGVRGKALKFDGTNDARTDETIEPPAIGAVAFWMRSEGPPSSRQRPWGIGSDYEVWQDPDGLMSMDVSTDGYQGGFITTDPLHTKGRWYHVVAQYDSDSEAYEIYLDGQLHKSGVSTHSIQQQAANYLSFGTRTGSTERFSGSLDDFQIYNRWLNVAEIAEIYGLVGWWRMEETSGTAVSDSSGAGNHGTLVGTPEWSSDAKEGFGGLELDGTNYVEMPTLILNDAPDGATVAGWAKLSDSDTGGSDLITLGDYLFVRLDQPNSGSGSTAFMYEGSLAWQGASSGRFMEGGGWHYFAAVYDADALEIQLYIDGVLRATESASGPIVFSGRGSKARIGKQGHTATNRDFTGLVDDVRVYNRAITPVEARTLFYGQYVPGLRIVEWIEIPNP